MDTNLTESQRINLLAYQMRLLCIAFRAAMAEAGIDPESGINISTEDEAPVGRVTFDTLIGSCEKHADAILENRPLV